MIAHWDGKDIPKGISLLLHDWLPGIFGPEAVKLLEMVPTGVEPFSLVKSTLQLFSREPFPLDFLCAQPFRSRKGSFTKPEISPFLFKESGYFSPLVMVEKRERFLREKQEGEKPVMDLEDFFVLPGAVLYQALVLARMVVYAFFQSPGEKGGEWTAKEEAEDASLAGVLEHNLSHLPVGSHAMPLFLGSENTLKRYRTLVFPTLLPFQPLNALHGLGELSKVVYHGSKVAKSFRLPHPSHENKLDMLESPESELIGLTLFLTRGARYNLSTLSILAAEENLPAEQRALSFSSASVPFLNFSDGTRVTMGGKNLKQAVPVLKAEKPMVCTGVEKESGALGVNALVAYRTWKGYTFEDGMVVSRSFAQKMGVKRQKKLHAEAFLPADFFAELSFSVKSTHRSFFRSRSGTYRWEYVYETKRSEKSEKGSQLSYFKRKLKLSARNSGSVKKGDWLVTWCLLEAPCTSPGKAGRGNKREYGPFTTLEERPLLVYEEPYPGELEPVPKERIDTVWPVISYTKQQAALDEEGKYREKGFYLSRKFAFTVHQNCPLEVGDKITGRHGNKGTVAKILDDDQMPLATIGRKGKRVEVLISPMSVVSRLNIGQLLEVHASVGWGECTVPPFSPEIDAKWLDTLLSTLQKKGADQWGYFPVDGKPTCVGWQYMVRLNHFSRDKLHVVGKARTSRFNDQPLKGKRNRGGQRIGEMEFWTLFDHGALHTIEAFALTNHPDFDPEKKYTYIFQRGLMGRPLQWKKNQTKEEKRFLRFDSAQTDGETRQITTHFKLLPKLPKRSARKKEFSPLLAIPNGKGEVGEKELGEAEKLFDEIEKALFSYNHASYSFQLVGKEGYLRKHMLGRRIHHSGRSVITPAPEADVDSVFLPVEFALEWFPKYFPPNDSLVRKAISGGEKERKSIANLANEKWRQSNQKVSLPLRVLLNRQPSLHLHSMQAFEPVFWEHYSIGLPNLVCEGLGADFDGDTIAVYLPFPLLSIAGEISGTWDLSGLLAELDKMKPSSHPFRLGDRGLAWSLSQDMVFGGFCKAGEGGSPKKKLGKELQNLLLAENPGESLQSWQSDLLAACDGSDLSLSFFDARFPEGKGKNMQRFILSGARGKENQFRQLYDSIEFSDPLNPPSKPENLDPFSRGLSRENVAKIARRSRNGLMTKKLEVAQAGYLTRKLVELLYPVRVSMEDCGTKEGLLVQKQDFEEFQKSWGDGKENPLEPRRFLLGRYVKSELEGEWMLVSEQNLSQFASEKTLLVDRLWIRSPVHCGAKGGPCARCCGVDLSAPTLTEEYLHPVGAFVGVQAGHVIGEGTTQYSMKALHEGKGLSLASLASRLFSVPPEEKFPGYVGFLKEKLKSTKENAKTRKPQPRVDLKTISVFSIHLELFYKRLQDLGLHSQTDFFNWMCNPTRLGLFGALSFEREGKNFETWNKEEP
ncbi:MAG TPA: hypothetical protein PLF96_12030, partial [Thermotogota bacterium]|nr:hypothetical protein [Thermotogota bacterium]